MSMFAIVFSVIFVFVSIDFAATQPNWASSTCIVTSICIITIIGMGVTLLP